MTTAAAAGSQRPAPLSAAVARTLALAACSVSLAASLWALLDQGACGACEAFTLLSGSPVLPLLGMLWYALLLGLLAWRGIGPPAARLISIGTGVHLALLAYMLLRWDLCAPCLLAATGAFGLAALVQALEQSGALLDWRWLVAAALVVGSGLAGVALQSEFKLQRELQRALATAREASAPPAGQVQLSWFSREHCERCEAFRREVLPPLEAAYGRQLDVAEHPASSGIPTPTVVIRGRHETILYPNPSLDKLRRVIDEELAR